MPTTKKRKNYLGWDETFMLLSDLMAMRSKDPSSQVGACIVNNKNVIVGVGYNGFPRGCSDDIFPWDREAKSVLKSKYTYVVHAEANAILNANKSTKNCKLYVNLFPCNECAKMIIQSGIKHVIYSNDKYKNLPIFKASKKMLKHAGIKITKYTPKNKIVLQKNNEE